eukprot:TRINITY_DN12146_c0_g1_i1.p1 TRINITY_DN12146_c0_g1~~TRINITY_DN12146_c0_g1_i1.p1  ORF type:complete len:373 (-),score=84.14 TRINITY_DN12146_c0_g1_i1:88-1206(-)
MYSTTILKHILSGPKTSITELPKLIQQLTSSNNARALIITGNSLKTKSPVIDNICKAVDAVVFCGITQHSPLQQIQQAVEIFHDSKAQVLISIGGGSPVDSTKVIVHSILNHPDETKRMLIPHIAIPTVLSVAEMTCVAGYSNESGHKVAVAGRELSPQAIIYDPEVTMYTPEQLWLSTGVRAVDHAIETLYNPRMNELPSKKLAISAWNDLNVLLRKSKQFPKDLQTRLNLQLAAGASLYSLNLPASIGLSHSIGHALGATYGVPHGLCSCLTLAPTLRYKAIHTPKDAVQIARVVDKSKASGDSSKDALLVAAQVKSLVDDLGLKTNPRDWSIPDSEQEKESIAQRTFGGKATDDQVSMVKTILDDIFNQ